MFVGSLFSYAYQFLDLSGIPGGLRTALFVVKAEVAQVLALTLQIPERFSWFYSLRQVINQPYAFNEGVAWFGPHSVFLIFPSAVAQFVWGLRRRDYIRISIFCIALGYLFTLSALQEWTPYKGRYFIIAISVLAPLISFLYYPNKKHGIFHWIVVVIALWVMVWSVTLNSSRPLVGANAVSRMSKTGARMLNNPAMVPVIEMLEEHVPLDSTIATRIGANHWDYPLFGPQFTREIIPLDPQYPGIDIQALLEAQAAYLLISPRERPFLQIPLELSLIGEESGWTLYSLVPDSESFQRQKSVEEALLGLHDKEKLLFVDMELSGRVGVMELKTDEWGIENLGEGSFLWLGMGVNQGLKGFLWSEEDLLVELIFYLQPGPSREDSLRNIRVEFYRVGAYAPIRENSRVEEFLIDGLEHIRLKINLHRGLNEFRLIGLDKPTIRRLPNGDTRPLMLLLNRIDVMPVP